MEKRQEEEDAAMLAAIEGSGVLVKHLVESKTAADEDSDGTKMDMEPIIIGASSAKRKTRKQGVALEVQAKLF